LGAAVVQQLLAQSNIDGNDVSEVIMGQVLTAGVGQNPARQAALKAGIAKEAPAWTLNQVCGSGLRSVALGYQSIITGNSSIAICGGQESMSLSPHVMHLRNGTKMGNASMTDTMIQDGLWDALNNYHMGVTAENIAREFQITRDEQDRFACESQNKAEKAQKEGRFDKEIVSYTIKHRKGDITFNEDEFPRHGTTVDALGKLRAVFDKEGSVTAGNASGINDGAAAVLLMTLNEAEKRGLTPLARIVSHANCGVAPEIMGTGPIPASRRALELANWKKEELDLIEANEAFAAQAIAVNKEMQWDTAKVNVHGGAIALGHPIGASGARILTTLVHGLHTYDLKKGLATLCVGGGMGVAMCVEKL
jgi:acetyl-CoA C-acetyltransferase